MILGYDDSLTDSSIDRLIVGSILRLIEELNVGLHVIMVGFNDGPTEDSSEVDALGRDDGLIDGARDGAALGFADGSELGIAVGSKLGLQECDSIDSIAVGKMLGSELGDSYGTKDGMQDGSAVGDTLGVRVGDALD